MRDWKEKHQDPTTSGGWFGNVISTVDGLLAAAEAGQFAVDPDTGAAIVKQLTDVQQSINQMRRSSASSGWTSRLGGGYAEQVSTFNQRVNEEGPDLLAKFTDEVEQLKSAVSKSVQNYHGSDSGNRQNISNAGDGMR
jgi:hypothetical protein